MTDRGVTTVIGTVIVVGIVVGAITLFQLTIVPNMAEEAEANHAQTTGRGMAEASADVLQQLRRTSEGPLSSTVPLARPSQLFVPDGGSASLGFTPASGNTTEIASPSFKIVEEDGQPVLSGADTGGQWRSVDGGETITQIDEMLGLRVKLTDPSPSDGDRLVIEATDAEGDYAGELRITTHINNPDLDLVVAVLEPPAPGQVVFHNHVISIHQQRWDSDFWLNALDELYGFDRMLADAEQPFTLSLREEGLTADFKAAYSQQTGTDLTTLEGAGRIVPDYERGFRSGDITHETQNEHYVDQTLRLENGALLREQTEGSAFVVDPPIHVEANAEAAKLSIDVPQLRGDGSEVSGDETGIVRTQTVERGTFEGTAGQLTLTLATESPDRWQAFLDDELSQAGLTSTGCPPTSPDSGCQYELSSTSETVRLTLHGPHASDTDPSDPERDLVLSLQHGRIATEVQR